MLTQRENVLRVLNHTGDAEWVPVAQDCYDFICPEDIIHDRPTLTGEDGHPIFVDGYDWLGCFWHWDADINGYSPIPGKEPITDITKWREQITFPNLDEINWESEAKRYCDKLDRENKVSVILMQSGTWERAHALLGFQEALINLYEEPEALKELLSAITDHRIEVVHRVAKYFKPDMIVNFDDYGHQKGSFFSKEMFMEFIYPNMKRMADAVKSHGIIYTHHSCGKVDSLMEEIIEVGTKSIFGCYAPYNDIEMVEQKYNDHIVIDGGSDNQYLDAEERTEEEIRAAIRNDIDRMAPYKNLVINAVVNGHPDRMAIIVDEVRKYGADYWKKTEGKVK